MEYLRRRIEAQMLSMTGLALGQIDFEQPKGDPGLYGPDAVCWQVHGDFPCMLIGGITALLLQMLHPLALAGVWDHSNFRDDMTGRLRRTGQFIAGTTFAARADADWLIDKVRTLHEKVVGTAADGRPYAASDPALLTWVHVAEVHSFMAAHLRYLNPQLSLAEQDRYYAETALIAQRLGAEQVPTDARSIGAYIDGMRDQLLCDERSLEVLRLLHTAPAPSLLARPVGALMLQAGVDLLPDRAARMFGIDHSPLRRSLVQATTQPVAGAMRWALRNGSVHRARRRLDLSR
jgi:uncharacterized protein (DUF2236 family)